MSINDQTEEVLRRLENLATQLDDKDHGIQIHHAAAADMISDIIEHYREIFGDE